MAGIDIDLRSRALRDRLLGEVLAGSDGRRYPLGECLGEGGQGWIFRATWNGSIDVVVKVLRPDVQSRDALMRFRREATILRTMAQQPAPNPHVVRYFDHASAVLSMPGKEEAWTFPFTVLEYVDGETLSDALAREQGLGLGLARARRMLRHMVLALRDVHAQNIVHRDLKPSNVLIDTAHGRGSREIAKVTDFGLAKVFDDSLNRTASLAGATVGYAPPEQFERGNPRVCKATDVFSLAAIVFEMLTGEPCFAVSDPMLVLHHLNSGKRPTLTQRRDRLPNELRSRTDVIEALDGVLNHALATSPDARYPTVTLFHDAVEAALSLLGPTSTAHLSDRPVTPTAAPSGPRLVASTPHYRGVSGEGMTMPAPPETLSVGLPEDKPPPARLPTTPPMSHVDTAAQLTWRVACPQVTARPFRSIALSADGTHAAAIGVDGLLLWDGRSWTRAELPRFVAPATVHALAWFGHHLVVAGASSTVHLRAPDGAYAPFTFGVPGLVFHGAYADAFGALLAGEQLSHGGSIGAVAMMHLGPGGMLSLGCAVSREAAPLRAVTRLDTVVVACGDGGTVAALRGGALQVTQLRAHALLAIVFAGEGAAFLVGAGGYVFRLTAELEASSEPVQTLRDLFAVARGWDGSLYAGGEDRRVLRREPAGWVRAGATGGVAGANVRALSAAHGTVTAFLDDGSILQGQDRGASQRP
jgi:eukaryotic-like serine/threonine-protein kinase